MAIKNSLTKDEILAIYAKAINGGASNRYEESIALKDAVLANFKNLFPNFGYGYFYEDSEDEIRVPIALNILFGEKATREENEIFVTVNITKPTGYGDGEEELISVEDFYTADFYEIPIKKFAEIFADKEFSEDNVEILRKYDFNE